MVQRKDELEQIAVEQRIIYDDSLNKQFRQNENIQMKSRGTNAGSVDQCKSFYEQWSIDSMNTYINLPPSLPLLLSFVSVIQHSFGHILISMRFIFCVIGSKLRFYCISVYGFIMFFTFDGNKIRIHLQVLMFADTHIH